MMKKIFKIITVFLSSLLIALNLSPAVVFADNINDSKIYITSDMAYAFSDLNDIAKKSYDVTNTETIEFYKNLALNSLDNITINSNNNIERNSFKVLKTNINGKEYTSANFAISGSYSFLSNLNLLFNSNNELIFYSETLISRNESNTFRIQNYVNGSLFEDKKTDIPYITDEQILEGINGLINLKSVSQERSFWGTVGCIGAVAGLNGVVAKLIAATCVAACTAAPVGGAVCAACVGGVCVMGAADIAAIVGCFNV